MIKQIVLTLTRDIYQQNHTKKCGMHPHFTGCSRAIWYFKSFWNYFCSTTVFTFSISIISIIYTSAYFSILGMDYLKFHGWDRKCPPILEWPLYSVQANDVCIISKAADFIFHFGGWVSSLYSRALQPCSWRATLL